MGDVSDNSNFEAYRAETAKKVAYDPNRPVAKDDLRQIVEAARWAPTAHNMQNFDIIVVEDKKVLEKIVDSFDTHLRTYCSRYSARL